MAKVKNNFRDSVLNPHRKALCFMTVEETLLRKILCKYVIADLASVEARGNNSKIML